MGRRIYTHSSTISKVSTHGDLVAIGSEYSVEVLTVSDSACDVLASFHIGCPITAIAWATSSSPSITDEWEIELAVAGTDFGLYLLTRSYTDPERIFSFGGGLSGHHRRVNDMTFCGGKRGRASSYLATVADDKILMVWDLQPTLDIHSQLDSPHMRNSISIEADARPQPTAFVIPFKYPLTSVCSHPFTSKELLVSDLRGSIFQTDWRSDQSERVAENWNQYNVIELVEPSAMSESAMGHAPTSSASVAWRKDAIDIIGAVYGPKFSLWDLSKLNGGKPSTAGRSFPHSGDRFRWCQSNPECFAISASQSPHYGALIHVHNINYPHAHPVVLELASRPQYVRDFDFLPAEGSPRLVAAVGTKLMLANVVQSSAGQQVRL